MGWFGGWAGRNATLKTSLSGLPDSLDFVSLWGNWKNLTQEQKDDLKFVQEKKGTKVLICWQVHDIGDQLTPDKPKDWDEKNPGKDFRQDRKSTRLNSSHANISYAVFCLKKKKLIFLVLFLIISSHLVYNVYSRAALLQIVLSIHLTGSFFFFIITLYYFWQNPPVQDHSR